MKSNVFEETTTTENTDDSITKRHPNYFSIILIFLLLISLISWTAITSMALFANKEPQYPKATVAVPLLLLLTLPAMASLFVILFRTLYTLYTNDTETIEPLDLVQNEEQRQLFLLPLSVTGMVMTILPAYYFHHKRHYLILGSQGVIGLLLVSMFLGMTLASEKSTRSIFIPIHEK